MKSPLFLLCQTKVLSQMANYLIVMIANTDYGIFLNSNSKSIHSKSCFFNLVISRFLIITIGKICHQHIVKNCHCWYIAPFFAIIEKENSDLVCLHSFRHTHLIKCVTKWSFCDLLFLWNLVWWEMSLVSTKIVPQQY